MLSRPLSLRGLLPSDFNFLKSIENDVRLWHLSDTPGPFTDVELIDHIEEFRTASPDSSQRRFVLTDTLKTPIGFVDLYSVHPSQKHANVGIVIADGYRQQGHGLQALKLLEITAFKQLKINTLYAEVGIDNSASIRLFQKAGFAQADTATRMNIHKFALQECIYFQKKNTHV